MSVSVFYTQVFESKYKRFKKKFQSIETDLKMFVDRLPQTTGTDLGNGIYKYRLSVKSKNKGKSGGFRIISFEILLSENHKRINLITIYDKSEQATITKKEISEILKLEGLI